MPVDTKEEESKSHHAPIKNRRGKTREMNLSSNPPLTPLTRRRRRQLESRILSHHTLETNTNTFNNSQQDGASDSAVADGFRPATDGERTAREETRDDGVPGVFLLA